MSTTNNASDDPQSHGTPPTEPHTPDEAPTEQPRSHNALAWATVGLSAACCTAGAILSLTGHEEAGTALIAAGSLERGVSTRK
ncbi:hypothetical protein [Streptomyces mayonensis]|uniref:hypothetical protein n=1 Tax=Streptomyces mayonensis TaxID=2750816 RepID=UPI001C1DFB70|nr:hypothetical protein [Streptomyces sp. A108]MBU6530935.1 hypothetical protein [Streptomyces sp. A108]